MVIIKDKTADGSEVRLDNQQISFCLKQSDETDAQKTKTQTKSNQAMTNQATDSSQYAV